MLQTIDQLIGLLAALAVAVLGILWPQVAGTWGNIIINMIVPILSTLAGLIYVALKGTAVNTEKKIELARAQASAAQAQLKLKQSAAPATTAGYTYTVKDVEIVLAEAISDIESAGLKADKVNTAEYDYTHMANYDLRPVAKEKRVSLSKVFLEKNLALLNDAWKSATNIPKSPTPEQAANKTTNMYYFKTQYNKYNPENPCGSATYDIMSVLLGYFNNVYQALDGINSLVGVTVDYSTFGGSMYSPTSLGWNAAACVM